MREEIQTAFYTLFSTMTKWIEERERRGKGAGERDHAAVKGSDER